MIHLFEQCADLNILCIAGVEVINVAIEYTGIDKCVLQIRSAVFALYQDKEAESLDTKIKESTLFL